jgi:hypothetical protein
MTHTNNVAPLLRVPVLDHQVTDATFAGYHRFRVEPCDWIDGRPVDYGSFEVFHHDACGHEGCDGPGWYWWPCFPGCLPDGDPSGPFPTAEGAYLDAIGD